MAVEWPSPNVFYACLIQFIFAIIGFFATLLAVTAYFRSLTIRKVHSNLLFLNLLVNALIYIVFGILYFTGYGAIMKNSNILGIQWVCKFQGFNLTFCCGMEVYTLMCIALERYFAIVKQTPLIHKQVIGLLVFGYCWIGLMSSIPIWNSSSSFSISTGKYYCSYPFYDHSQIATTIFCVIHCSICISVINYCYTEIFRYIAKLKKNARENVKSTLQDTVANTSQKKECCEAF